MALEASAFSRTLLFLGRAVGGVRGAVRAESCKKKQPNTWPEPFPSALIPSIPLGLAGHRAGRPQARNGTIFASCGSVLVF